MQVLKSCNDRAFEIVVDLTHTTQLNEPDVSRPLEDGIVYWELGVHVEKLCDITWMPPYMYICLVAGGNIHDSNCMISLCIIF